MDLSHVNKIDGYPVVPGSVRLTGRVREDEERVVQIAYTFAETPGESVPIPNRVKWIMEEDLQYL